VRYWLCTLIGLALCLVGLLLVSWALYELVHIGTCASGGPYVSARPCPPGTGLRILAIFGAVFSVMAGVGVYAARGGPGRSSISLGGLMFGLGFLAMAAAGLVSAFGGASTGDSGAKLGIGIMAGVFIPMGLAPIAGSFFLRRKAGRAVHLAQHGKRARGRVLSVEDTGVTINDNPRVKLVVLAEPSGEPSFQVEKTVTVSRLAIPRQGDAATVFYIAGEPPDKAGISFDAEALKLVGLTPNAPPPPAPSPFTPPAPQPLDRYAELQKLGELRARGVLTQEEFEREKARILGSSQ
jgi:hypothetical protein